MKALLISLVLMASLLVSPVVANEAGVFYNPTRNGEGATIFVRGKEFIGFIYTYQDGWDELRPVVSPSPGFRVENKCLNCTTWYIAQSVNYDGNIASGELFGSEGIDYPLAYSDVVGATEQVGTFVAIRAGNGWNISVTYTVNPLVDVGASLYSVDFLFRVPLLIHE